MSAAMSMASAAAEYPVHSADARLLQPFELEYSVVRNGREVAEATLRLTRKGQRWVFETETRGTRGLASLAGFNSHDRSEFELHEGRLRSLAYQGRHAAAGRNRERILDFDWEQGTLIESGRNQGRWSLQDAAVDRHLALLVLSLDLEAGRAAQAQHHYPVAWSDGVDPLTFAVAPDEELSVPAGSFRVLRAERLREHSRRQTLSWHAPDLGHLPVRIQQRESGRDAAELRLVRARFGEQR